MIVFTGLSGSGKSSLAFDTIFAEGQRRYVESLSAYARQFLGQMDKPDVDFIDLPENDPHRERMYSEHLACLYDDLSFDEIGRASCRERVSPYV